MEIIKDNVKNHYKIKVTRDNQKINDIMKSCGFSSRVISTIKRKGELLLNDKPVRFVDKANAGDIIEAILPEEHIDTIATEGPLDIVYEDSEVLIVNKPPFLVTHPTNDYQENTLANYIADYFKKTGQNVKIRFVNRLDRDTTGLVIVAKNKFVHHYIQSRMKSDEINKSYIAYVENTIKDTEGTIDLPIHRPTKESIERVVDAQGQPSITHYKVLETYPNATKVECRLETGRTHQIRVHMKAIGNPLIGDPLYNPDGLDLLNRQALHAKKLEIVLPKSGKMEFNAELPEDLKQLENNLRMNGDG